MKLLLDECVDHRLRANITGHDVFTVAYMGWSGVKNGDLLQLAASESFYALLTTDGSIQYQHNRAALPVAVIWLNAASNDVNDLLPLVSPLLIALLTLKPCVFVTIP